MFQTGEIMNLIAALAVTPLLYIMREALPSWIRSFFIGFFFVLCTDICTVLEGVGWFDLFNTAEHLFYAFAAFSFAAGCISLSRQRGIPGETAHDIQRPV